MYIYIYTCTYVNTSCPPNKRIAYIHSSICLLMNPGSETELPVVSDTCSVSESKNQFFRNQHECVCNQNRTNTKLLSGVNGINRPCPCNKLPYSHGRQYHTAIRDYILDYCKSPTSMEEKRLMMPQTTYMLLLCFVTSPLVSGIYRIPCLHTPRHQ